MPSRPMTRATDARRLSLKGTIAGTTRVAIDVSQPDGAARARGSFSFTGAGGAVFEAADIGVLQSTKDWVSFTAVVGARGSIDREAVSVVVERADPFLPGRPRTVTLSMPTGTLSGAVR